MPLALREAKSHRTFTGNPLPGIIQLQASKDSVNVILKTRPHVLCILIVNDTLLTFFINLLFN